MAELVVIENMTLDGVTHDRYVLSIHPLALGHGRRLRLPAGGFELTDSVTTGTGVLIATYARTTP